MKKWLKAFPVVFAILALVAANIACGGSDSGGNGNDSGNDRATATVDKGGNDSGNDNGNDSGNDNGNDSGNDNGTDNGNDNGSNSGDDEEAIQGVLDEFMTALQEKDYDKAYELSHADLKEQVDGMDGGYKAWAKENEVFPTSWTYDDIQINDDEATVKLAVEWEDESGIPMIVTLKKDDDQWGIYVIEFENPE